jgi:hypothetical protein
MKVNRHQIETRKRHQRKAYKADPVQFGAELIKQHGTEKARAMFIERAAEFDGEEWRGEAPGLFDNLCVPVAAGTLTIVDGGELPQELAQAMIRGDIPSGNASKPGIARDTLLNAIKPVTDILQ